MANFFSANLFIQNLSPEGQVYVSFSPDNSGNPDPAQLAITMGKGLINNNGVRISSESGSIPLASLAISPTEINLMTGQGAVSSLNLEFSFEVAGDIPQAIFIENLNLPIGATLTSTLNDSQNSIIANSGRGITQSVGG